MAQHRTVAAAVAVGILLVLALLIGWRMAAREEQACLEAGGLWVKQGWDYGCAYVGRM
jgi:hypothetical protein